MKMILLAFVAMLLFFAGMLAINSRGVIDTDDPNYDELYQEKMISLVDGRCSGPEGINRRLLQQTWFYSRDFQNIAMAFGQATFSLHDRTEFSISKEGAYCIDGSALQIQYFSTEFVPTSFGFGEITFGPKISPENKAAIIITALDNSEMSFILDNGEEQTVYRENYNP